MQKWAYDVASQLTWLQVNAVPQCMLDHDDQGIWKKALLKCVLTYKAILDVPGDVNGISAERIKCICSMLLCARLAAQLPWLLVSKQL